MALERAAAAQVPLAEQGLRGLRAVQGPRVVQGPPVLVINILVQPLHRLLLLLLREDLKLFLSLQGCPIFQETLW